MTTRSEAFRFLAPVLALVGCGGGGGSGDDGGGGRHLSWQDDGVVVAAVGTRARLSTSAGRDYLEITGTNFDIGMTIALVATTPLVPQTFVCDQTSNGQSISVSYSYTDGGVLIATKSCTAVLIQVGAFNGPPTVGTFESVFTLASGGTKNITKGSFSLPLSM